MERAFWHYPQRLGACNRGATTHQSRALKQDGLCLHSVLLPWAKLDRTITGPHDTNGESFSDHSVIIPIIIVPVTTMHSSQVGLVDCSADSPAQTRSCILVESKMNSAVNASVGDVVGNLPE